MREGEPIGQWEQYEQENIPENMSFIWARGGRSFFKTIYKNTPESHNFRLFAQEFADYGTQLDEGVQDEALARAIELAEIKHHVHHVRYDNADLVPESWENSPYRDLVGHSIHKVGPDEWIEIDGEYYLVSDFEK